MFWLGNPTENKLGVILGGNPIDEICFNFLAMALCASAVGII